MTQKIEMEANFKFTQEEVEELSPQDNEARALLASHLYKLADRAFTTEIEREKKLEDLSAQLLTCITILSVAFLTPASFLFECYTSPSSSSISQAQIKLAWMYAVVLIPLAACLVITLRARMLRPMEVLESPKSQSDFVDQLFNAYKDEPQEAAIDELTLAENYCDALQGTFQGMRAKLNNMWKMLECSIGLVIFSCVAALLFGLHLLLELCG